MSLEATHVDICRDETTRTAYPRLASSKGIAATGANSAVIAALEKAAACNNDVLERAPVDADLQYAPRKRIIVTEHKNGILEKIDCNRGRVEAFVADRRRIVDPRGIWWRVGWRERHAGIRRLPQYSIWINRICSNPSGRQCGRRHIVEALKQSAGDRGRAGSCRGSGTRSRGRSCRRGYGYCRRWTWRIALKEADDLENLVGPYLVRHAGVLSVPTSAACAVTVARVLPNSAGICLNSPIVPEPLPVWVEILDSLHRNPIGPRRREYADWRPLNSKIRRRPGIGPVEKRSNQRARHMARYVGVDVNIERRRRSAAFRILAHHAHSGEVQEDWWRRNIHNEVVGRLVVERVHRLLELLRTDAERRFRCRVVILVPEAAARWNFWR